MEIKIIKILANHPRVRLAFLFGSCAREQQRPSSDIDLAVAARQKLDKQEKMALIDDLALSFGRPIDLVDLNAVSGTILQQVLCKGVLLINKQQSLYAKLIIKMWYNQADFMPVYNMVQQKKVKAFAYG